MVFTILTFFVSNGVATIWHGFVCDLTRIDQIRRIFNVFVDFCPIPPVSCPGQTPGGPWPSGPGRPLGRPRVGPGRVLGGPWAPVKCMFDGGCLNGQGTDPVKNSVKNPVENSVDFLVNFCPSNMQFRCRGTHTKFSQKNPLENSPRKSGSDFAYKSDQRDGLQLHPGVGLQPKPGARARSLP